MRSGHASTVASDAASFSREASGRPYCDGTRDGSFSHNSVVIACAPTIQIRRGRDLTRHTFERTDFDCRADRAMELARALSPGAERQAALKRAGLLRQIALLAGRLGTLEKPVRGKRPTRMAKRTFGQPQ
jgi:hypothetical protein